MKPDTPNRGKASITINGTLFDARTGQPLDSATRVPLPKTRRYGSFDVKPAATVHAAPAKSQTLRRTGLQKPAPAKPLASRHVRTISPVATHPSVSRFGRPRDTVVNPAHVVRPSDVLSSINAEDAAERPAGFAAQVQNYTPAGSVRSSVPRSYARTAAQLKRAPNRAERAARQSPQKAVESRWKKFQRRIRLSPPLIVTGIIFLVVIAGVACYLTVPALSLFVAAKSAGVDASYPNYVPEGYRFKGPVTYGEGTVTTTFAANGSDASFSITQKNTTWDSGAVRDNYVLAKSPQYLTYSQGGITVYTFGPLAAWVNGGVLHTIDGTANLTSEQVLRLAGSM